MMSEKRKDHRWKIAAFTLLAAQLPCAGPAWPQSPAKMGEEFTKQEKIYRSQGKAVPGGYVTYRTLKSYTELLPSGFSGALGKLGPKDRWLDIGAGSGQAILDYYADAYDAAVGGKRVQRPAKARAVAMSIEDRRTNAWHQRAAIFPDGQIRYLYGKRMREYSREELGRFQLITDVYGGFSYTDNLSLLLESVLAALEVKGSFYTMVQSVHLADDKDDPAKTWYLTELVDEAGRDVKVCTWLKSLACVKVACESKSSWDAPTELIHVQKVCDRVSIPSMKLLQYEAGQPPGRRFLLNP